MAGHKDEIITFKVETALAQALRRTSNRSEFIRNAVLSALDHMCPLCQGTGILTPSQKTHWEEFAKSHSVEQCEACAAVHIVCGRGKARKLHGGP